MKSLIELTSLISEIKESHQKVIKLVELNEAIAKGDEESRQYVRGNIEMFRPFQAQNIRGLLRPPLCSVFSVQNKTKEQ